MSNLSREDLIEICEDAVVSCSEWHDRDSYGAQYQLNEIHGLLKFGAKYTYSTQDDTIWVTFKNLNNVNPLDIPMYLDIDDRDDFFNTEDNADHEMLDASGAWHIDENSAYGFLPTKERLLEVDGSDWY